MRLVIEIEPFQYAQERDMSPPHHVRIKFYYRGQVYMKELVNYTPELLSMMDYIFEVGKKEMKQVILTNMNTGSPIADKYLNPLHIGPGVPPK